MSRMGFDNEGIDPRTLNKPTARSTPLINSAGIQVGWIVPDDPEHPGENTLVNLDWWDLKKVRGSAATVTKLPTAEEQALKPVFEPSSSILPLVLAGVAAYFILS